ncbi:manganese-dependent inorganic pyrophosphatase [Halalkalicoccus paucihalophilus]|uniref:Manganese-dependent inorganic pyrophosphatase n=1 Tax=Halalkalicoccus paucihalophilus TaxID=1008153 RepID=A0A151ADG7_9EURY|nr:DHH family phosphoesterase [Halalkalicoccus paucihalophilus]KYH25397.1 manganese-dependent inorganic pyrophosphatase [Halalkalicoccus paucihalophilus]
MSTGVTISSMSRYAILGCGSVGHAVADELIDQGKDVLIVDRDDDRVETLRDRDMNAQVGDIREEAIAESVAEHDVVLILSSDVEANKAAVSNVRARDDDQFIIARASDPVSGDELAELGANSVINPSAVIAESALRLLESGELEHRAQHLSEIIAQTQNELAIVTHENPDPDAIASAVALRAIAEFLGVDAEIFYFGDMGHQENRAFVNLLDVEMTAVERDDPDAFEGFDTIALVDHAMLTDTTARFDQSVDVLIDHHDVDVTEEIPFVDIRPEMNSTSTILTKYIQEFDLSLEESVATALLYGIRAETLDFKRDTTPADLTAAAYLYPFANHDTLEQVESPSMSPETLDVLAEAITNREVQGSHLVSNAGFIRDREALEQAAQHLLNLEGITTTAVFGIANNTIYLAARSKDIRLNIGRVLLDAFEEIGETMGHSTQARVEIPLGIFTGIETNEDNRQTLLHLTEEAVRKKLFTAMGVESEGGNSGS